MEKIIKWIQEHKKITTFLTALGWTDADNLPVTLAT